MPMMRVRRRGFTLVELLIVIALLGLVMAAMMKVLVGQQRFYRGAAEMIDTQTNVRDAVNVLESELRGISAAQGDILEMSADSIRFFEPIGTSIVCVMGAGRTSVVIPPLTLAAENGLTSWVHTPAATDRVLFYDLGTKEASTDDAWRTSTLASAPVAGATCPNSTGFTTTAAEATQGYTLPLSAALDAAYQGIVPGSSIRFSREVRLALYQAGNGLWYLGYQECPGDVCDAVQPVSGPYLAPSATAGQSGLTFTYYDNTGTVLDPAAAASLTAVARIDVTTRSATLSSIQIPGFASGRHTDSLSASIALRN